MDSISAVRRSANMSRIRSKDTEPEMLIRRMLHALGYRYSLHRRDLPGVPDVVFPGRGRVIFVQGCFWHQHKKCVDGKMPSSRIEYWKPKLLRNVERDRQNISKLRHAGWKVMSLWECEVANHESVRERLIHFLGPVKSNREKRGYHSR